ncbi:MAG: hypothetical protein AAB209_04445 [Bacteroidota bacterium]
MKKLSIALIAFFVVFTSCNKKQQSEAPKELQSNQQGAAMSGGSSAVAGIKWSVPSRWSAGPEKPMRVATYNIPAADGDGGGGECGVFFFGGGQGGDVEMNISRWVSQFENASAPDRSSKEVNGMKVELVEIAGTYLAPSGPMMQSSGKKENYRLLGAIVAAPEGSVFFKLTGPAKAVAVAENDFNSLVGSLAK